MINPSIPLDHVSCIMPLSHVSYSHLQGDTSPQGDPELYIASVRALYERYCQDYSTLAGSSSIRRWPPLIVNTHGWIKGIGLDVLAEVLAAVNPTHMIQVGVKAAVLFH